jgi:hypothetical protein
VQTVTTSQLERIGSPSPRHCLNCSAWFSVTASLLAEPDAIECPKCGNTRAVALLAKPLEPAEALSLR